ncbi:MAG: DUF4349 domain-containing protein [Deltaproteobacteria bacterium]|nr:DUF4349 domain-containing protein [Deltaproteobacteria bacterium]
MDAKRSWLDCVAAPCAALLASASLAACAGPMYAGEATRATYGMQETAGGYDSWALPGMGYSEPDALVLAQVDQAAGDRAGVAPGPTGPAGPGTVGADGSVATDAAGAPDEGAPGQTWEEIALPEVTPPSERLVIKTGTLRLELDPPEDGPAKVTEIAGRFGGYVSSSSETSIVIRVPNESFEQVLEAIAQLGNAVEREVSGEDVTEQYFDLNVRLRNALAVRLRYLALLEMAETVEDALLVERELERVTLEIEELRGKLRFLRDRVQDATITVWFVQEYEPPEESSPGPLGWIFYGVYLGVKWLFVWDEPGPGR